MEKTPIQKKIPGLTLFSRALVLLLPFVLSVLTPGPAGGIIAERIMAIVNNEVIALSDVREYGALFRGGAGMDQKAVLEEIIGQKVFLAEAQKMEIAPPDGEEVRKAYAELVGDSGGPEAFGLLKTRLGLSDDEIHHLLKTRLHVEKLIEQRIRSFVFVTPRDINNYLKTNPGVFSDLPEDEKQKSVENAVRRIKSEEKAENYLERLKAKADIQINFPR